MLPELFGTFRANPGCATKATAVATTWQRVRTTLAQSGGVTGAGGADQLPISDTVAFLFRNPAMGVIVYFSNPSLTQWTITTAYADPTLAAGDWVAFTSITYSGALTGTVNPVQNSFGQNAIWVDTPPSVAARTGGSGSIAQTILQITGLGATLPYTWTLRCETNGLLQDIIMTATTDAGGNWQFTLPLGSLTGSSYRALQYNSQGVNLTNVTPATIKFVGNCTAFQHMSMAQWNQFGQSVQTVSVNSASLMWTNTASELNRQGQACQLQVPAGQSWPAMVNITSVGNVAGGSGDIWLTTSMLPGAVAREAKNGAFSFLRPTSATKSFTRFNTQVFDGGLPLVSKTDPDDDFLMMYLNIGSTTNAQTGYWTAVHGAEYETLDVTRELVTPPTRAIDFLSAIDISTSLEQHHTNGLHISDIVNGVAGVANALLPASRVVTQPLSAIVSSLFGK